MCLSLEPVENLWKMADFDRVTVSLHILYTANQRLRARKIGLESNLLGVQSSE